ncbi:thiol:disulfide interchange protein DsbG [Thiomonas sp.]
MRKLFRSTVLAAVAAGVSLAPVVAAADVAPSALPPVMAKVTQAGVTVVKEFKAIGGLNGWLMMHGSQPAIAYTTPDGKALLFGALVNDQGQNMTAAYMGRYVPKPKLNKLIPELEKSAYVTVGNPDSKHMIYAFVDPNCIFCHLTNIELTPYIKAGLQVRLVMVGFLKPDSAAKAAAILEAKNPAKAWATNEKGFNETAEEGGITGIPHPSAKTVAALQANMALMQKFGFNGTPGIVYQQNGKWQTINGMPQEAQLPAMTGLPAQAETNPQLARFQQ